MLNKYEAKLKHLESLYLYADFFLSFSFHYMWERKWYCFNKAGASSSEWRQHIYSPWLLQVSLKIISPLHVHSVIIKFLCSANKKKITILPLILRRLPFSSPQYYVNETSTVGMENVLVVTLPPRNYSNGSNFSKNSTVSCTSNTETPLWREEGTPDRDFKPCFSTLLFNLLSR